MTAQIGLVLHAFLVSVVPARTGEEAPMKAEAAAEDDSLEALDQTAREAYAAREYERAAAAFKRAHEVTGDPNYLFNVGRVYEESGDLEQSVEYYERFLEQPEVTLEARRGALERAQVLREILALRQRPRQDQDEPAAVPPSEEGLRPTQGMADDPKRAQRRKTLQTTGIVLASIGGAGLVVGAVLGGLAQQQANILDDGGIALEDRRRRVDAATTYATTADGLFIGGGVLAVTGLALIIASVAAKRKHERVREARLQWSPVVTPSTAAMQLHVRF